MTEKTMAVIYRRDWTEAELRTVNRLRGVPGKARRKDVQAWLGKLVADTLEAGVPKTIDLMDALKESLEQGEPLPESTAAKLAVDPAPARSLRMMAPYVDRAAKEMAMVLLDFGTKPPTAVHAIRRRIPMDEGAKQLRTTVREEMEAVKARAEEIGLETWLAVEIGNPNGGE